MAPGKAPSLEDVVVPAAEALGRDVRRLLREIAAFVEPSGSGESDPRWGTISSYWRDLSPKCGYKFAGMVLDFLHENRSEVKNPEKLTFARNICSGILGAYQKNRYEHPARTNPASVNRIKEIAGAYLLIRRATSDKTLRKELLILVHEAGKEYNTHATYITPNIVCRGSWCVILNTASCMTNGFRGNYKRPDVVNLHLLYEEVQDQGIFLSGFLAGIKSNTAEPAVVPVVAIRISPFNSSEKQGIWQIGNVGDAEIRRRWGSVTHDASDQIEKIGRVLDKSITTKEVTLIRHAGDLSSDIREAVGRIDTIIPEKITEFCKSYTIHDAW
jgi:hypothetical protein